MFQPCPAEKLWALVGFMGCLKVVFKVKFIAIQCDCNMFNCVWWRTFNNGKVFSKWWKLSLKPRSVFNLFGQKQSWKLSIAMCQRGTQTCVRLLNPACKMHNNHGSNSDGNGKGSHLSASRGWRPSPPKSRGLMSRGRRRLSPRSRWWLVWCIEGRPARITNSLRRFHPCSVLQGIRRWRRYHLLEAVITPAIIQYQQLPSGIGHQSV